MENQSLFILIQSSLSFALIIILKICIISVGYLIVKLGHDLLSKGIEGKFKFSANFAGIKADLVSVSPGLLFVLLGVFLIGYSLSVEKIVETKFPDVSIEAIPHEKSKTTEPPNFETLKQ